MRFFKKLKKLAGYHITEYSLLLVTVMGAIIIMGPYVIRAWNAQMKSLDDGVSDSLDDPLFQIPDNTSLPGCTCGPWEDIACGANTCSATQMYRTRVCLPLGCTALFEVPDPEATGTEQCNGIDCCRTSECCCTNPVSTGYCGAQNGTLTGLPRPGCAAIEPNEVPLLGDGTCPDGYMKESTQCGEDTSPRYVCIGDAACVFRCTPTTTPLNNVEQVLCAGSDQRLTAVTAYTFSDYCTGAKCELQCKNGNNYWAKQ